MCLAVGKTLPYPSSFIIVMVHVIGCCQYSPCTRSVFDNCRDIWLTSFHIHMYLICESKVPCYQGFIWGGGEHGILPSIFISKLVALTVKQRVVIASCYMYVPGMVPLGYLWYFQDMSCVDFIVSALFKSSTDTKNVADYLFASWWANERQQSISVML